MLTTDYLPRLDEACLTTAAVAHLSGVSEKNVRNWIERIPELQVSQRHFTGRRLFTLLDAIKLAVIGALVDGVALRPSDAAMAAEAVANKVAELAGEAALLDYKSVSPDLALILRTEGGRMRSAFMTAGGFGECRPHITLPVATIVARVIVAAEQV